MTRSERAETALGADIRERLESVLDRHPISFAMVFGSAARGKMDEGSDLDLAVEFDTIRPTEAGYSETYFQFQSAVEDAVPLRVDVVDVHSMSPQFARAAFEQGETIVGSEDQRADLEDELVGEASSVADAHERVAAAVDRLREGK